MQYNKTSRKLQISFSLIPNERSVIFGIGLQGRTNPNKKNVDEREDSVHYFSLTLVVRACLDCSQAALFIVIKRSLKLCAFHCNLILPYDI